MYGDQNRNACEIMDIRGVVHGQRGGAAMCALCHCHCRPDIISNANESEPIRYRIPAISHTDGNVLAAE